MIQEIEHMFIRPQRQLYHVNDLCISGSSDFPILNQNIHKYQIKIPYNKSFLPCSLYQKQKSPICIVYLHTHNGSRIQGLNIVTPLVNLGLSGKQFVTVCLFDFWGYGNAPGEYVTLGLKQHEQIGYVLNFLELHANKKEFILWGRSMGAVASILYCSNFGNEKLVMNVYDSPFSSLNQLISELGSLKTGLPQFIIKALFFLIKGKLNQKAQLDCDKLQLQDLIKNINVPGIFLSSNNDQFVNRQHVQRLFSCYSTKKKLISIHEDHHQSRSSKTVLMIVNQLKDWLNNRNKMKRVVMGNLLLQNKKLNRIQLSKECKVSKCQKLVNNENKQN